MREHMYRSTGSYYYFYFSWEAALLLICSEVTIDELPLYHQLPGHLVTKIRSFAPVVPCRLILVSPVVYIYVLLNSKAH